jgi:hypothetical protein
MTQRRRSGLGLTLASLVLVTDQVSKAAVLRATELRQGGTVTIRTSGWGLSPSGDSGMPGRASARREARRC